MIVESTILTLTGSAIGLAIAYAIRDVAVATVPVALLPRLDDLAVNSRVFAFAVALALLAGFLVGLVPAIRASRPNLNDTLKDGTPGATDTRSQRWLRSVLTIAETSLAILLLVGAGLLLQSFGRLMSVDPGFDPNGVLTARISLPTTYPDAPTQNETFRTMLGQLRVLPGVEVVSISNAVPMDGGFSTIVFSEGAAARSVVSIWEASPEYARVLRIPLRFGRWISDDDIASARPVVVVSETVARQLWPDDNPIGRRLRIGPPNPENTLPMLTVVGVVADVRTSMSRAPRTVLYAPYTAGAIPVLGGRGRSMIFAARLSGRASGASLENVIRQIEPNSAVTVRSMEEIVGANVQRQRFQTSVLSSFAGVAIGLAMLGVYSVVAFSTTQRTREIGLRMALGAAARDVVAQMMRQGVVPALVGLGIGLVAASALSGVLESYLFEVEPAESSAYALVAIVGLVLVLLASWIPARRAARVDPMVALRYE